MRYRVGAISPSYERTTELTRIDQGTLYITNKRFFFDGAEKNSAVTYDAVVRISLFDGGFELEKNSGRSPHLKVPGNAERVAALAVRCHMEWHNSA
jgi:hypothetical protein